MKPIYAARVFFVLLAIDLSPDLLATEPGYDKLLDQLPMLLEQTKEVNAILQQGAEHKRAIEQPQKTAPAAETKPESMRAPIDGSALASIPQIRTDPFQVSYFMLQKAQVRNLGGAQFTPLQNAQAPALSLKGIINEKLALLEVQNSGVYLVRKGDTLSIYQQGQSIVIKIEKIDRLSLMVKMGTLAEIIVVR